MCIWNLRDGSRRNQWHESEDFSSVSFHPNGRYVAAGDDLSIFWVWDIRTGQLAAKCKMGGTVHLGVPYLRVTFAPDGKRVATARDQKLWCWDFSLLKDAHSGSHEVTDDDGTLWQPGLIFECDTQEVGFFSASNLSQDFKLIDFP